MRRQSTGEDSLFSDNDEIALKGTYHAKCTFVRLATDTSLVGTISLTLSVSTAVTVRTHTRPQLWQKQKSPKYIIFTPSFNVSVALLKKGNLGAAFQNSAQMLRDGIPS